MSPAKLSPPGVDSFTFENLYSSPTSWLRKAQELRRAARALGAVAAGDANTLRSVAKGLVDSRVMHDTPRIHETWLMLLAFMLENVFKGLRIAQDPTLTDKSELSKGLTSHSLATLAARASIPISAQERAMLDYLSNAAVVDGRYPCDRSAKAHVGSKEVDLGAAERTAEALYLRAGEALIRAEHTADTGYALAGNPVTLDEYIAHELR
jgi:hypothetical protein